ncbi:uncharacterized protein VTP21DRAFT_7349 [Calcarisporiella thermophila]|uniref:uncharacterized protein n=1 Tax=Calcarisporiella thermophila TaxID=911321 RepID=UPI00374248C1
MMSSISKTFRRSKKSRKNKEGKGELSKTFADAAKQPQAPEVGTAMNGVGERGQLLDGSVPQQAPNARPNGVPNAFPDASPKKQGDSKGKGDGAERRRSSDKKRSLVNHSRETEQAAKERRQSEGREANHHQHKSFASAAASNLESLPPAPCPKPIERPLESESPAPQRINGMTPEKYESIQYERNQKEVVLDRRPRKVSVGDFLQEERTTSNGTEGAKPNILHKHLAYFDRDGDGKFTIYDTYRSLRALGANFMLAAPAALLLHVRYSPPTAPWYLLSYLNPWRLITLPIYVKYLNSNHITHSQANGSHANNHTHKNGTSFHPSSQQQRRRSSHGKARHDADVEHHVREVLRRYGTTLTVGEGRSRTTIRGVTFMNGLQMISEHCKWWDISGIFTSKFMWILTYWLLHDHASGLVTDEALRSCIDGSLFYRMEAERQKNTKQGRRKSILQPERVEVQGGVH